MSAALWDVMVRVAYCAFILHDTLYIISKLT